MALNIFALNDLNETVAYDVSNGNEGKGFRVNHNTTPTQLDRGLDYNGGLEVYRGTIDGGPPCRMGIKPLDENGERSIPILVIARETGRNTWAISNQGTSTSAQVEVGPDEQ